ncbi:MAG: hypothetical protein IJT94_18835 [Oscillibacter sp.]|nr:hypothetical protein [Oscillibacter sp.]
MKFCANVKCESHLRHIAYQDDQMFCPDCGELLKKKRQISVSVIVLAVIACFLVVFLFRVVNSNSEMVQRVEDIQDELNNAEEKLDALQREKDALQVERDTLQDQLPWHGSENYYAAEGQVNLSLSDDSERSIKIYYGINGTVRWKSSDNSGLTCKWTDFENHYTDLILLPHKVGEYVITLTNNQNDDICIIAVTVTS